MIIALDEIYRDYATPLFARHKLRYFDTRKNQPDAIVRQFQDAEVLCVRGRFTFPFEQELIEELPRLQFVQKPGTGFDWLDIFTLSIKGILLANNAGVNASCVAEHVVLLTLLCLRKTFWYLANTRNGIWKRDPPSPGIFQLEGKTVGIVGMGAIGCNVAKRMTAFGANIIAHQRDPRSEATILAGVRWVSLDDLLRESDVVTLSVPLTKQTEMLIGARELGLMKRNAVLINTSRGRVVEEHALYEALASRQILAAGLDVFVEEPISADNQLLKLDNVLATPHIAGHSVETDRAQIEASVDNIVLFANGRRPLRLVNPEIIEQGTFRATIS